MKFSILLIFGIFHYAYGTLGRWSEWSKCSATCGQGKQQRNRECFGPRDCDGHLEEERNCPDLPSCKGRLGQWSDWSECSATCGRGGYRKRTRKCIGPGDCHGLGHLKNLQNCVNLPSCIGDSTESDNVELPPEFEPWSEWGDCSSTCGEGTRTRTRTCPGPVSCIGDSTQSDNCPDNPPCDSKSSGGLSGGVIAGIIGIIVVLGAVGGVIFKAKYLIKIQ